ncbi:MAG: NADH-quinone oxidoreductase subunit N [bacterium]|nr:NADH-quinone oxidoreductase subunit N [bacterium]
MIPDLDVGSVSPMIIVACGAILLPLVQVLIARKKTILGTALTQERRGIYLSFLSLAFLGFAFVSTLNGWQSGVRVFNPDHPMILMDGVTHFLNGVILISAILTVMASSKYLADIQANHGEYYALLLASVVGMMFLVASTDLLMLFLALEMMSIPVYALAGFRRTSLQSNESALKYFLIGSFASGLLLYGCALLYGATGSLEFYAIGKGFDHENPLDLLGAGLVLIGLGFKISSVPFHQWAPDTYEGAPTSVSGFMATAVKVAAFGVLARVVSVVFVPAADSVFVVLWVLAVLSMTVGNVMALIQRNTKRMLAYSSIAHAGYLLVGVIVGGTAGTSALLFYLLVYTFMTIGAFTVVAILARDGEERDNIDDLSGLIFTRPFLACIMALCMFSLAGIPLTAGFMGKFQLFLAAIQRGFETGDSWLYMLAIIGVINSAVSLGYYLRVPVVMFMQSPSSDSEPGVPGTFEATVLAICGAMILLLGVIPHDVFGIFWEIDVLSLAQQAAGSFTR